MKYTFEVRKVTGEPVRYGPNRNYYYYISSKERANGFCCYLSKNFEVAGIWDETFWFKTEKAAQDVLDRYNNTLNRRNVEKAGKRIKYKTDVVLKLRELHKQMGELLKEV